MSEYTYGQDLTFNSLQSVTATTAKYETMHDPLGILRAGLIEETDEFLSEEHDPHWPDLQGIQGEIGDITWYAAEIARYTGETPDILAGMNDQSLRAFQRFPTALRPLVQVFDSNDEIINFNKRWDEALAIYALRVVDVMNPKTDELWRPSGERIELQYALGDLMMCTAITATRHGVGLNDAAWHTVNKLQRRSRETHVIEQARKQDMVASYRQRLFGDRWVRSLLTDTVIANAETIVSTDEAWGMLP